MSLTPLEMAAPDVAQLPDPEQEKEIAGRSPIQIAVGRLRSDKIAMMCLAVFIFFFVVAIFAPLIARLFGVEVRAGNPSTDTDIFNFPVIGPPDHPFTWEAPLGLAPNTGNDNLAEWLYGARTSLGIATISTFLATIIGITVGSGRRLQPRLARPVRLVRHRRLPVAAVPADGAGAGPDHHPALQRAAQGPRAGPRSSR